MKLAGTVTTQRSTLAPRACSATRRTSRSTMADSSGRVSSPARVATTTALSRPSRRVKGMREMARLTSSLLKGLPSRRFTE